MIKCTLAILSAILLTSCRTHPPTPPHFRAHPVPLPALKPHFAAKSQATTFKRAPMAETLPGFVITNVTLANGQVAVSWQNGPPPFQVEGEPSLAGPWNTIGPVTMRHSATFDPEFMNFFRVQGAINLLSITSTNPTTLSWTPPQLDMSDTLTPNKIQRRYTAPDAAGPNYGLAPDDDRGWDDLATVAAGSDYTDSGSGSDPSVHPVIYYREREVTANGVFIPVGPTYVGGTALPTPGTTKWVKQGVDFNGGSICTVFSRMVTDGLGRTLVGMKLLSRFNFGGADVNGYSVGSPLLVVYNSDGSLAFNLIPGGGPPSGSQGAMTGVAVDASNNIYLCGDFEGTFTIGGTTLTSPRDIFNQPLENLFVIKLDPSGSPLWAKQFGVTGTSGFTGSGRLVVDGSGNLICVCGNGGAAMFGSTPIAASGKELVIFKLDSVSGNVLSAHALGGANSDVAPFCMELCLDGNIVIGGIMYSGGVDFGGGVLPNGGGFLLKVAVDGTYKWCNSTPSNVCPAVPHGIAVDPVTGDVVWTGANQISYDYGGGIIKGGLFLVTYNSSGAHQRSVSFNYGNVSSQDFAGGICISRTRDITFAGATVNGASVSFDGNNPANGSGVFVASFKYDFTYRWNKRPTGVGNAYGEANNVGLTGTESQTVSAYTFQGDLVWDNTFSVHAIPNSGDPVVLASQH